MKILQLLLWICLLLAATDLTAQSASRENDADRNYALADSLMGIRAFDQAIPLLLEASSVYQQTNNNARYADCLISIANSYFHQYQWEKCWEYADKSLAYSLKEFGDQSIYAARSYLILGRYQQAAQKNKEALAHFQQTIDIIEKNNLDDPESLMEANNYSARSYYILSNSEKSLQSLQNAIEFSKALYGDDAPNTINLMINKGVIYYGSSQLKKSLAVYQSMLPTLSDTSVHHQSVLIKLYNNMGNTYLALGEYQSALASLLESISINEKLNGKNSKVSPNSLFVIASTYVLLGKYDQAEGFLEKGRKLVLELFGENHPLMVSYANDMATILMKKGKYDEALAHQRKALEISYQNGFDIFRSYGFLVNTLIESAKYEEALKVSEEAFDFYNQMERREEMLFMEFKAKLHLQKGIAFTELQRYQEAQAEIAESLQVYEQVYGSRSHSNIAAVLKAMANVYSRSGNLVAAINYYDQALEANAVKSQQSKAVKEKLFENQNDKLTYLGIQSDVMDVYIRKYHETHQKSYLDSAIITAKELISGIDQVRAGMLLSENKLSFLASAGQKYEKVVNAYLLLAKEENSAQYYEQAFDMVERSKQSLINEAVDKIDAAKFLNIPSELIDRERKLIADQAYYKSKIVNLQNDTVASQTALSAYQDQLFYSKRQLDSIRQKLQESYAPYFDLKYGNRTARVGEVQQRLTGDEALIEFYLYDQSVVVFIISKEQFEVTTIGKTEKINGRIKNFRDAIVQQNQQVYMENGHALYQQLVEPILKLTDKKHLIIVPDKELWHLNFDLLLTEDGKNKNYRELPYLLKSKVISYANSATLLLKKNGNSSDGDANCLAISYFNEETYKGDNPIVSFSNLRNDGVDLPGTRDEIRRISKIIDGKYLYGQAASEKNFIENASDYSILHIALHGEIDGQDPENSKLIFNASLLDSLYDNILYSHELYALNLPAKLTVLSACNTGTGSLNTGEGIINLGHAFQYAGTESLLLSAWEVADLAAPDLIEKFYRNLTTEMSKPEALQKAKLDFLQTTDFDKTAPFYWGNFYLLGNPDPVELAKPSYRIYWIVAGGFILLLALFGLLKIRRV